MRSTVLNARSEYALDGSLVRIDALLDRARELKMNAAGLVDRASLLGIPHFLSGAHRRGLRVLLGAELPLLSSVAAEAAQGVCYPLVVYATSPESLGRLARLVSRSHERARGAEAVGPHLHWEDLAGRENPASREDTVSAREQPKGALLSLDGLIAQSPGQTGEVSVRILRGQMDLAEWLALRLAEVFGRSSFFLGITVEGHAIAGGRPDGRADDGRRDEGARTEFRLADETSFLAHRLGLDVVASNVVDYLDADDARAHEGLGQLLRRRVGDADSAEASSLNGVLSARAGHMRTPAEFERLFRHHPAALKGLDALTERAALDPGLFRAGSLGSDGFESGGFGSGRGTSDDSIDALAARVSGVGRVSRPNAAERRRLHQELEAIRNAGLAPVLLRLAVAMEAAAREVGGGGALSRPLAVMRRGPVSGSLVAHRLGLTPVNPLEAGLSFSVHSVRHGDAPGVEPVLIEVAEENQAAWLGSIDRSDVARAGLLTRLTRYDVSEALRDLGLASNIPTDLVRRAALALDASKAGARVGRNWTPSTLIHDYSAVGDPVAAAFRNDPRLARAYQRDERVRVWFDTARRIVGLPRLATIDSRARILGLHDAETAPAWFPPGSAGFQSAPGGAAHATVTDSWATAGSRPDSPPKPVLQWTGEHPEFGCAFFSQPDVLSQVVLIRVVLIRVVDPSSYDLRFMAPEVPPQGTPAPDDSPKADREDSLMSAQALSFRGMSVVEPVNAGTLPARSLHQVTEAIALEKLAPLRPGLAERYVRRRGGREAFQILDAGLKPILAATFGLLIYEEQIVDMAVRVAGFSADEAEQFRREIAVEVRALPGHSAGGGPAGGTTEQGSSARAVRLAAWRIRFVRGAVALGVEVGRAEEIFAGLLAAGAVTVSRAECVAEAMRLLREARGFGAVRDGRSGVALPAGVTPLPLPRRQFVLPWLETPGVAASLNRGAEEVPLRKRA